MSRPSPAESVPADDAAGRRFSPGRRIGPYRVVHPLAEGGMGHVYLAHDDNLDRPIALKVLPASDADEEGRARFLREARALARVDHENVVRVNASGADGDVAWMALEYIEGDPLDALLGGGALDEVTALLLAAQAARGLAAVHEVGVVHRDIKPANLIVDARGVLRVVDFGVALVAADEKEGGGFRTQAGVAVGTPHFMSPEQARGRADERADAWALGATLFSMLTGVPPFYTTDDEGDLDVLARVLREEAPDVRTRVPTVSEETAELLAVLLSSDAGNRPGDLAAVADVLEDIAAAVGERGDSVPPEEGAPPPSEMPTPRAGGSEPPRHLAVDDDKEPTEPTTPERRPSTASAEGGDAARETPETAAPDPAPDPEPAPAPPASARPGAASGPPPSSGARATVLAAAGGLLLVAGVVAGTLWRAPEPAPVPVPVPEPAVAPPDLVDPDVLLRPGTDPEPPPPDPEVVEAQQITALVDAIRAGGDRAAPALVELVGRRSEAAQAAVVSLAGEPGPLSALVVRTITDRTAFVHLAAVEAGLAAGTEETGLAAVKALEALRNDKSVFLLNDAANAHPSAAVKKAALDARRRMFAVQGEDDPPETP